MKPYRMESHLYNKHIPLIPKLVNGLIRFIHNCAIYSETKIDKVNQFDYSGIGVVTHGDAVIGKDCVTGASLTLKVRAFS